MTCCRLPLIAFVVLTACTNTDAAPLPATIQFSLDAPFCGTSLPAQFFVDSQLVGTDTFRVNLAPNHTLSRGFSTAAGRHVLGARVTFGGSTYPWPDTPDTVVTLTAGMMFTRVLPFYCS